MFLMSEVPLTARLASRVSGTTRWARRLSGPSNFGSNVTKFAPHKALKSTASGKDDF